MTKRKINLIILIADIILGAALLSAAAYYLKAADEVSLQSSADRWAYDSEMPYSAISVYTGETSAFSVGEIYSSRKKIIDKVKEQLSDTEDGFYSDCYSARKELIVSGNKDSAMMAAFITGGDYFTVHIPEIVSGSVYTDESANIDTIVLDDLASWKLFGSLDTSGMNVSANGKNYIISAVIRSPQTKYLKNAYEDDGLTGTVYLPYQSMEEIGFSAYDILLPDPIEGFAEGIVRESFGFAEDTKSVSVIDSRSEFKLKKISENAKNRRKLLNSDSDIIYPFYADADRAAHMDIYTLYSIFFVPFVLLLISACYWIVSFCALLAYIAKRIYRYFDDKADKKKLLKYYETHPMIIIKPKDAEEGEEE